MKYPHGLHVSNGQGTWMLLSQADSPVCWATRSHISQDQRAGFVQVLMGTSWTEVNRKQESLTYGSAGKPDTSPGSLPPHR